MAEYPTPPGDFYTQIRETVGALQRQLKDLQRPSGTNIAQLVAQVQQALVNINATVIAATNAYLSSAVLNVTGVIASGGVTAGGRVVSTSAIRSPGSRSYNMTSSWAGAWIDGDGTIGISTSSERFKENIEPLDGANLTEALYQAVPVSYTRIGSDVTELGFIAERFVEIGLGEFVWYDSNGLVEGIHYDRISIALVAVVQRQREQLLSLDQRLSALESPTA